MMKTTKRLMGWSAVLFLGLMAAPFSLTAAEKKAHKHGEGPAFEKPDLPAFPGAEGFGARTIGGRGGKVLKVTNLNASGPGSLKWALAEDYPRIVVFEVSGIIKNAGEITASASHLTLAGQTAPGAGITLDGNLILGNYHGTFTKDFIVRFIRMRPIFTGAGGGSGDGIRVTNCDPAILDHVSVCWGTDEVIQFSGGGTLQWSASEGGHTSWEGHHCHNYGAYFYNSHGLYQNVHHTLIAHAGERCPQQAKVPFLDVRNIVVYNSTHGAYLTHANAVGNYFKEGPGGPQAMRPNLPIPRPARPGLHIKKDKDIYVSGNMFSTMKGELSKMDVKGTVKAPITCPPVTTQTAEEGYELVLAHAGCLPRDAVSKKVFRDVRTGTGFMGRRVPEGGLMEGLTPGKPKPDADNDGMPDAWEKAHKLDPNDSADSNKIVPAGASKDDRHKGYTYIEYYINECADTLIGQAMEEYEKLKTDTE